MKAYNETKNGTRAKAFIGNAKTEKGEKRASEWKMREKEMPMKKSRTRIDKGRKFPFIDFMHHGQSWNNKKIKVTSFFFYSINYFCSFTIISLYF